MEGTSISQPSGGFQGASLVRSLSTTPHVRPLPPPSAVSTASCCQPGGRPPTSSCPVTMVTGIRSICPPEWAATIIHEKHPLQRPSPCHRPGPATPRHCCETGVDSPLPPSRLGHQLGHGNMSMMFCNQLWISNVKGTPYINIVGMSRHISKLISIQTSAFGTCILRFIRIYLHNEIFPFLNFDKRSVT